MARTRQTARKSTGGKAPRKFRLSAKEKKSNSSESEREEEEEDFSPSGFLYNYNFSFINTNPNFPTSYSTIDNSNNNNNYASKREEEQQNVIKNMEEYLGIDGASLVETSFYAHYFETKKEESAIFSPRYSLAKCKHPLTGESEYWMSVNFVSKFDGPGIQKYGRPVLNLVVALDISGSMFNNFEGETGNSKMKVAKESLLIILSQLKPEDSFGLVLFNETASVVHPLTKWKDTDTVALEKKIMKFRPGGGTELTEGLKAATAMYAKVPEGCSNRIFFLTDMEVNSSQDGKVFTDYVKKNSNENLWCTVIGIGMDLTLDIIENVSKTPGANYCNVRSTNNFKELMDKEFGYLVCPIAFNIDMNLESETFRILSGFGTPEVNGLKPGETVHLSTEFPTLQNDKGETRPGPLLFCLEKIPNSTASSSFSILFNHEDLQGITQTSKKELSFPEEEIFYQDLSIRKAILLVYYSQLITEYLKYFQMRQGELNPSQLMDYHSIFNQFKTYYEIEKSNLGDNSLNQEVDVMNKILDIEKQVLQSAIGPEENLNSEEKETESVKVGEKRTLEETGSPLESPPKKSKEEESSECVICLYSKKNILLLPCKHVCVCEKCSEKLETCPLCRKLITSKTKVFI